MWPVIAAIGPLQLRSYNLAAVLAFLLAAFIFWRKGRDEHYREEQLFDSFLLSSVIGLIGGRVVYVATHLDQLGWQPLVWLDAITHPGVQVLAAVAIAGLALFRFAKLNKWDAYEIMDYWVTAVVGGLWIVHIGAFLAGASPGTPTSLPWGIIFPGQLEKHHPTQIYSALMFLGLFWYLSWVEYRYRTFGWYRRGKKAAQTGFVIGMGLLISGLGLISRSWIQPSNIKFLDINIELSAYGLMALGGLGILLLRSGRLGWLEQLWQRPKRIPRV